MSNWTGNPERVHPDEHFCIRIRTNGGTPQIGDEVTATGKDGAEWDTTIIAIRKRTGTFTWAVVGEPPWATETRVARRARSEVVQLERAARARARVAVGLCAACGEPPSTPDAPCACGRAALHREAERQRAVERHAVEKEQRAAERRADEEAKAANLAAVRHNGLLGEKLTPERVREVLIEMDGDVPKTAAALGFVRQLGPKARNHIGPAALLRRWCRRVAVRPHRLEQHFARKT